jgi:hypothetical protein
MGAPMPEVEHLEPPQRARLKEAAVAWRNSIVSDPSPGESITRSCLARHGALTAHDFVVEFGVRNPRFLEPPVPAACNRSKLLLISEFCLTANLKIRFA